jgi:hypothetical protein
MKIRGSSSPWRPAALPLRLALEAVTSRAMSLMLLLVFAGNAAVPAFFTHSDSDLPPCCRRNGAHHCAMMHGLDADGGSKLVAAPCPNFPAHSVAVFTERSTPPPPATVVMAVLRAQPADREQIETLYRVSYNRTRQKRGPPTIIRETPNKYGC